MNGHLESPTEPPAFRFTRPRLHQLARELAASYRAAKPFPHVVIDDFLPQGVCQALLAEFPGPGDVSWERMRNAYSEKLAFNDDTRFGDVTWQVIAALNSGTFITFLEELTGIDGLIPDPHLKGGGLHQIIRGGRLGIHADFNCHEGLQLDRRLNLLLYLNPDWREEHGGHLELWERDMSRATRRILPVMNRAVIFSTTDFSYHGHPEPLRCPEGWSRKSLALYYYSNGRPAEERSVKHSTLYRRRPGEPIHVRAAVRGIASRAAKLVALLGHYFFE